MEYSTYNTDFLKYLAGFFDAEGSITISKFSTKTNMRYQLQVRLANRDSILIENIRKSFGGGGYIRNMSDKHTVFELVLIANQAKKFLEKINPFLILKKEESECAIKFQNSLFRTGGKYLSTIELDKKEAIKKEMKNLHRRIYFKYRINKGKNELYPYMAGLIDGDGHICILHGNTLTINLTNKNHEFLICFMKFFKFGFVKKNVNWSCWIISSRYASKFLEFILPYFILKSTEANLAIEFQNSINPNNIRHLSKQVLEKREIIIHKIIHKIKSLHLNKGPRPNFSLVI